MEIVRRERRAFLEQLSVGILLGAAIVILLVHIVHAGGEQVTAMRRNSRSTQSGRRAMETMFTYAASGPVIQPGTANGEPSACRTT